MCVDFCFVKYLSSLDEYEIKFVDLKTGDHLKLEDKNQKAGDFISRVFISLNSQKLKCKFDKVIILCS